MIDLIINNLRIPVEKDGADEYLNAASRKLKISAGKIQLISILRKSLDLSDKEQFYYDISIAARIAGGFDNPGNFPVYQKKTEIVRKQIKISGRPVIIGFGPAGMFAALELIERGIKPLIFERGKKIEERSIDVGRFNKERILDPESNIQFGEGGAGSYSDGKLFSRASNSYHSNKVLDTFIKFGAPEEIGYHSKPHLGTDILCKIVVNMRNYILQNGGEIYYSSKMTDLLISNGKAEGVIINGNKEYRSSIIYLALGHSARDTFEMIHKKCVAIEQKPISVGMRIEHPVEIINLIRYGNKYKGFPGIGAAVYSFNYTDRKIGSGAYTFCMCPGGEVVNASSENGFLAVNGMSYSKRASPFSNSAVVVPCHLNDYGASDALAGIRFQKNIEQKAFTLAGGNWKVPAQNLVDFMEGKISSNLNKNSCKTGTTPVNMSEIFPRFVSKTILAAFNKWKEDYPLFVSEHAILLGSETRATCPVRIKRGETYESINIKNLFPIGEGAGYAGGITSSAADAIKAVEKSIEKV